MGRQVSETRRPAAAVGWSGAGGGVGAVRSGHRAGVADAVVIGAGVNGLTAAVLLADAGWDVDVLEAADDVGGACRSAEVTAPGFVSDLFSAFYPFGKASPILSALGLEEHGLAWSYAPSVLAHPTPDGRTAVLSTDLDATAASADTYAAGDGAAWRELVTAFRRIREPLLGALFTPFPPVRSAARLGARLGPADALRFARFALLPVRRFAEEQFTGAGAGLLLAGNALHTDLGPDSAGSAVFGWLLAMLGQDVGFPVPVGGAGRLSGALASRARAAGVRITTGARVQRVVVRAGRAVAVQLADGSEVAAGRAVVADVDAPQLYLDLVGAEHLPARMLADLGRFQWDNATLKVDWALSGPVPWAQPGCAGAGTLHLGGTMDDLTVTSGQLARRLVPSDPFMIFGQMTTSDATRSPAGTESAWAYLHVPQHPVGDAGDGGITGRWDDADVARLLDRLEARVERDAPGFRNLVIARHVQGPRGLQSADGALHRGALNGGTASLHQQLVFRPVPGLGRAETPVRGLYLGSMSAHPGGGVHGGPGANAARAALSAAGLLGPLRAGALDAVQRTLYRY